MKASIGIIHDLYEKLLSDRKKGNIEEFTYDETVDHIKNLMEKSDLHYKKKWYIYKSFIIKIDECLVKEIPCFYVLLWRWGSE